MVTYHYTIYDNHSHIYGNNNHIIFECDITGGSKHDCQHKLDTELIKRKLYSDKLEGLVKIKGRRAN